LDETDSSTWSALGYLLHYSLKRFQEAEVAYRRAISLREIDDTTWCSLGYLLHYELARFEEAEVAYQKAISLDGTNSDTWFSLGGLLSENLKRFADAETAFRTAIRLNGSLECYWSNLGLLLHYELRRFDEAERAFVKALEIDPTAEHNWLSMVWLWRKNSELPANQSIDTLSKLFQLASRAEQLSAHFEKLITSLLKANKLPETLSALEQSDLKIRAQPLVEALRALKLDAPAHLATLAAEVRETSYQVLKRLAPEFAARVAREMPAMVASFVLPDSLSPQPTRPDR
jgi:tetratricopeptide (TPR) repeat protein